MEKEISVFNSKKESSIPKSIDRLKNVLDTQNQKNQSRIEQYKKSLGKIVRIPIEDILLDENVRKDVDTKSSNFQSFLSSVKKHGIQQNIVVEFRNVNDNYKIVCVSGHRRVIAARMSGVITTIPALIKQFDDVETRIELGLIENLLREDLHCLDVAEGYKNLREHGWSREKLCKTFGKTDRTIHSYLKMSEWSPKAKEIILDNVNIFTTKLLTRKVACRKFKSEKELIDTLNFLQSGSAVTTEKSSRKVALNKKLDCYLSDKDYSTNTLKAIRRAFKEFNLIC